MSEVHHEEPSSPIKTPQQLITVVVLAFVVPIAIIVMLSQLGETRETSRALDRGVGHAVPGGAQLVDVLQQDHAGLHRDADQREEPEYPPGGVGERFGRDRLRPEPREERVAREAFLRAARNRPPVDAPATLW